MTKKIYQITIITDTQEADKYVNEWMDEVSMLEEAVGYTEGLHVKRIEIDSETMNAALKPPFAINGE